MKTLQYGVEAYSINNEPILIAQFDNIDDAFVYGYMKSCYLSIKEFKRVWIIDDNARILQKWEII